MLGGAFQTIFLPCICIHQSRLFPCNLDLILMQIENIIVEHKHSPNLNGRRGWGQHSTSAMQGVYVASSRNIKNAAEVLYG